MTKLPGGVLAALLLLLLGGCGRSDRTTSAPRQENVTRPTVALVFPVTVDAFVEFRTEAETEVKAAGADFAWFSAEGDPSRFQTAVKAALMRHPAILVAVGSQVSQTALNPQLADSLPKVVASCINAPDKVEALVNVGITPPRKRSVAIISDSPKRDIYVDSAQLIKEVVPAARKLAILYNNAEINSKNTAQSLAAEVKKLGMEVLDGIIFGESDVEKVTRNLLLSGADVLVIPHDKFAIKKAPMVVKLAGEVTGRRPVPVFSLDNGTVRKDGAAFGMSVSYGRLGKITGRLCARILKGENPAEMPVIAEDHGVACFNALAMERCGLTIPALYKTQGQIYPGTSSE
jgi:putative tryptophan/tyrosine transport system substrate-binding protein